MNDDAALHSPPPAMADPIGLLVACHRKLEARLDALGVAADRLAAGVEPGAAPAVAEALAAAVAQLDGPGRWHLEDEEASVLPRLIAADPAAAGVVSTLAPEHEAIDAGWDALRPVLLGLEAELRAGRAPDPALVTQLRAWLPSFTQLHRRHHQAEEATVLPRVRAALGADALAAIAAEMRARRDAPHA